MTTDNVRPDLSRQLLTGIGFLLVVAGIALLGSLASTSNVDGWYATVEKVPWTPPNWLFAPAWGILYFFIAITGWLIWRAGWRQHTKNAARKTLTIYTIQLVLNGLWTPVFFAFYPVIGFPAWWIAMAVITALIVTVIALVVSAWKWSRMSTLLMLPYVLWLVFASTLNAGVIALN